MNSSDGNVAESIAKAISKPCQNAGRVPPIEKPRRYVSRLVERERIADCRVRQSDEFGGCRGRRLFLVGQDELNSFVNQDAWSFIAPERGHVFHVLDGCRKGKFCFLDAAFKVTLGGIFPAATQELNGISGSFNCLAWNFVHNRPFRGDTLLLDFF